MKKKYIIIFIVCILIGVGFSVYRNRSKEDDTLKRNESEYSRITEIAKKSPKAGLSEMGRLLEKYYAEKHKYPPKLLDLYPEYLANKSLIEEVEWEYMPGKDDFLLKKAVVIAGQRMIASIDRNLRPKSGEVMMVASTGKVPYSIPGTAPLLAELTPIPVAGQTEKKEGVIKERIIEPEFALIRKTVTVSEFEDEISRKFLVWKDDNGVLGFGNVQYPHVSKLTIYNAGQRYDLQRSSYGRQKYSVPDEEKLTFKRDLDAVASNQSREHLVWKNRNGTLGFGNLQYPENKDVVYINVGGTWRKTGS